MFPPLHSSSPKCIIIDARLLDRGGEAMETYEYARYVARRMTEDSLIGSHQLIYVVPRARARTTSFGEDVAFNRGADIRVVFDL